VIQASSKYDIMIYYAVAKRFSTKRNSH